MNKTYPLKYSPQHPYNRYSDYLKQIFGKRMQKISIDAGFTCPNIDGTIARGGCIYCNNQSFNPNFNLNQKTITQQIDENIKKISNWKKKTGYIAYLQSYTNTHGPLNELEKIYHEAIAHPSIDGIIIATRPDCLPENTLDLITEINSKIFTGIEIGIESTNNNTLKAINRGHTWEDTLRTIDSVKSRNIHLGGHIILGLPGENQAHLMTHATKLATLPLDTIKLHQLQIIKNTELARQYYEDASAFRLYSIDEYIEICIYFAEKLNPDIVIERFASESMPNLLAVKKWNGIKNHQIADRINKTMRLKNTWQSKHFDQ